MTAKFIWAWRPQRRWVLFATPLRGPWGCIHPPLLLERHQCARLRSTTPGDIPARWRIHLWCPTLPPKLGTVLFRGYVSCWNQGKFHTVPDIRPPNWTPATPLSPPANLCKMSGKETSFPSSWAHKLCQFCADWSFSLVFCKFVFRSIWSCFGEIQLYIACFSFQERQRQLWLVLGKLSSESSGRIRGCCGFLVMIRATEHVAWAPSSSLPLRNSGSPGRHEKPFWASDYRWMERSRDDLFLDKWLLSLTWPFLLSPALRAFRMHFGWEEVYHGVGGSLIGDLIVRVFGSSQAGSRPNSVNSGLRLRVWPFSGSPSLTTS